MDEEVLLLLAYGNDVCCHRESDKAEDAADDYRDDLLLICELTLYNRVKLTPSASV